MLLNELDQLQFEMFKRRPDGSFVPKWPGDISYEKEKQPHTMVLPPEVQVWFNKLKSNADEAYGANYTKFCGLLDKLLRGMKSYGSSTYSDRLGLSLHSQWQDRPDLGSGMTFNYLKYAIDYLTSMVATFDTNIQIVGGDLMFRDDIENEFNLKCGHDELNRLIYESYYESAVIGYSHVWTNPWTTNIERVPDWQVGLFASEVEKRLVKRALIRDYDFPITKLGDYLSEADINDKDQLWQNMTNIAKDSVELILYIDAIEHVKYVIIDRVIHSETEYKPSFIPIETMKWGALDWGGVTSCPFDVAWPVQKQINQLAMMRSNIISLYKPDTTVVNGNVEPKLLPLDNGTGDLLVLQGATVNEVPNIMGTIKSKGFDDGIVQQADSLKQTMFDLLGLVSLDPSSIDKLRGRGTGIAVLFQVYQKTHQTEIMAIAYFIERIVKSYFKYRAANDPEVKMKNTDLTYAQIWSSNFDVVAAQVLNLSGEQQNSDSPLDEMQKAVDKIIKETMQTGSYNQEIPAFIDRNLLKMSIVENTLKTYSLSNEDQVKALDSLMRKLFVETLDNPA